MNNEKTSDFVKQLHAARHSVKMMALAACNFNEPKPETATIAWVSCSDRLPEQDGRYLVWRVSITGGNVCVIVGFWAGVFHLGEYGHHDNVTHWMPLPAPPEDGNE